MFKQTFLLGLFSGILATIACIVYSRAYFSIIADFSEVTGFMKVSAYCIMTSMIGCFVFFGLNLLLKKIFLVEFIFNLLFTLSSITAVFLMLKSDDPQLKNEDAAMMVDYYKGFVMPMLFFPALAWMTLKPLFIIKK